MSRELKPEQLRYTCDECLFEFNSTADVSELVEIIGQDRAVEAIEFGMGIEENGFNIFALGPTGAGKTATIKRFVEEKSKLKPVPDDWCYVHNFDEPREPNAIRLAPGRGREFRKDMEKLVEELKREIQQALEREDYENERTTVMEEFQKVQAEKFSELEEKARTEGFSIQRGPTGVLVVPVLEGQTMSSEQYSQLSKEVKKGLEEKGQILQQELQKTLRSGRDLEKKAREKLRDLERQTVLFAVDYHIEFLRDKYREYEEITTFLGWVQEDVVENARSIISPDQEPKEGIPSPQLQLSDGKTLDKYKVNLIVDNSATEGAPVVVEANPTFHNLIGKMERRAQYGTLFTDFSMIKPGALHRANGGYLIIEADHLFRQPYAYDALKQAIKDRMIKITDYSEMYSPLSTSGVEPEDIPLDLKVIIIGGQSVYYSLYRMDEEFAELFKVKADFNIYMERSQENMNLYARFLSARCRELGWRHFDRGGISRIVEYGSELPGDQSKLSTRFSDICDLASEANYWAEKAGSDIVRRVHVQKALDAKRRRANRVEEAMQEMIEKGDIFIDTLGEKTGQVNGLSVLSLGDYSFGKPSRITARTYVGRGGIVNIEREVKMSGPIHDKGVLILTGYLNGKYGRRGPVALSASIGFEQLYEGVEGDSASSTELYALLSSLSGFPVKQGIAVTGSVNQMGEVQPIGGATQKIEGFFDVCNYHGLTADHGVMIPAVNIKNLMLREEIVEAVDQGKFHIYPVRSIDDGIEILTGKPSGEAGEDGVYPEGTVNRAVSDRLTEFAEYWKESQGKEGESA